MTKLSQEYIDYLQSPEWDVKRRKRLRLDNYTCQGCGARDVPLDVDHITYKRFGHERMSDLQSLCRPCHERKHGKRPFITFSNCNTCGKFLMIFVRRIKIFGTSWTEYTCQDGHVRSYRNE